MAMKGSCWLIGDRSGRFPLTAGQTARLHGLNVELCPVADWTLAGIYPGPQTLLAIDFRLLGRLEPRQRGLLKERIERGATLYVRGGIGPGEGALLWPLRDVPFKVSAVRQARAYRFACHPMLPKVFREEQAEGEFTMLGADGLAEPVEALAVALHVDGVQRPSIFTVRYGLGAVIYDLSPDELIPNATFASRLENPITRAALAGALVAAGRVAGCDPAASVPFSLVVDDRPANFDYLSVATMSEFLRHVEACFPGVHIDFAWTPNRAHPSRRYIEILKNFNTGFVWHGFLRHIDHRTILDLGAEMAEGRQSVASISRRYGVRFQPVMVFPYERDNAQAVEVIKREGFVAKAESSFEQQGCNPSGFTPVASLAPPRRTRIGERFAVLKRSSPQALSRDRMIALAALGMPIIAAGHPGDVALRRLSFLRKSPESYSYFDSVLDFARDKSLDPRSLEEVAQYMLSA
jgi:hypothetical protein